MDKNQIYSQITKEIPDITIYIDEPMSKHTSFKVGGSADIFIKIKSENEIKSLLKFVKDNKIPLTIIGNGSNLIVRDNGIRGIVAQMCIDKISIDKDNYTVNAFNGVKLGYLATVLQKEGFSGFEFAAGIPGTIGGAVRMNAGAYGGEFKDIVQEVTVITRDGEIMSLKNEQLDFSYRHSRFVDNDDIILNAVLKLEKGIPEEIKRKMDDNLEHRKEKQPLDMPSAGSTFKRGEDFISAKLIDEAGLKGYKIGGAMVSEKHAGFIVNTGNATAQDIIDLIEYVSKTVYDKYGKTMEKEVEIIGE